VSRVPSSERRLQLIEAAARVISREGTVGATTRLIALEAGAPLATVHYNFSGKEELYHAVLDYCRGRAADRLRAHPLTHDGLRPAVRALLTELRDWTLAEPEFQVAQYELFFWALRTPSARSFAPQIYHDYHSLIADILRDAISEGDDLDSVDRLAWNVMAVTDGMILQIIALGPDSQQVSDADQLAAAALAGIAPMPG
jgi:AcrR family transcriptional regulator